MPVLNWIGKEKVITHHNDVPYHTLKRTYSFDENGQHEEDNGSENMIIHGDNLIALKALLPTYEGRVNCIYIDPPYNTGNEGWVYNDNVNDPRIKKWLNQVVGKEGEDLSRHDKWLCMMYPRLQLLRQLLAEDGAIFISIDDNESANLKSICDEIFGRTNFIGDMSWQRTYSPRNDAKGISIEVEHILAYSKNPNWQPNKLPRTAEMDAKYSNPDNDFCAWRSSDPFAPGASTHQAMVYAIQQPFTGQLIYPNRGRHWALQQASMLEIMNEWCVYELRYINDDLRRAEICGVDVSNIKTGIPAIMLKNSLEESQLLASQVLKKGTLPKFFFSNDGKGGIRRKTYLNSVNGRTPTNLCLYNEVGHTDEAKKEQKAIFSGDMPFETPKPVRLLEHLLTIATKPNSIVLDCFAGSATTAHAVLNLNKKDGGRRQYICVELMNYAEAITAERVKRVIRGYSGTKDQLFTIFDKELKASDLIKGAELLLEAKEARKEAQESGEYDSVAAPKLVDNRLQVVAKVKGSDEIKGTGGNFSFYELGAPVVDEDGFNPSVTEEEKKAYIWQTETRTKYVPLQDGSDGCLGIRDGQAVYLFHDDNEGTVFNRKSLCNMKHRAENYVVYADACTFSEEELDRMNIVFRKIPRDVITK